MEPNDSRRLYTALTARDARFDGVFFVGVTSTDVYCRPICPAKTPKEGTAASSTRRSRRSRPASGPAFGAGPNWRQAARPWTTPIASRI